MNALIVIGIVGVTALVAASLGFRFGLNRANELIEEQFKVIRYKDAEIATLKAQQAAKHVL